MELVALDNVPAVVANVPVVGKVTLVAAVVVKVNAKLPAVVKLFAKDKLPAKLIVLSASLTLTDKVLAAVKLALLVIPK